MNSFCRSVLFSLTSTLMLLGYLTSVGLSQDNLIYQEGFNDDGDGTRYTIIGRGNDPNGPAGPFAWDHSFDVTELSLAGVAPAKRAAILWDANEFFTYDRSAFDVWSNLVDWAVDGKEQAHVAFFPSSREDGTLDVSLRLQEDGHQVSDITDLSAANLPDPSTLDLIIHTNTGNIDPPTGFAQYPVPLISYNASNHDDTLISRVGPPVDFDAPLSLDIVEENADHPILEGFSGPISWTVAATTGMQGIGDPAPGAATLLTYNDTSGMARPGLIVMEEGAPLLGSFSPSSEGAGYFVGADLNEDFGGFVGAVDMPRIVELNPVDISGAKEDVYLTVGMAASLGDFEDVDYLRVMVGEEGAIFPDDFVILGDFGGINDASNPCFKSLSADGGATCLQPDEFADQTFNVSELAPGIANLVVRFEAFNTWPTEIAAFDNVRISDGPFGPVVVEGIEGDYNNNGQVERDDLDLVLLNWGDTIGDPESIGWTNDLPFGVIDQGELGGVLLNWGNTAALGSAPVPEPRAVALAFLALLTIAATRRFRA